MTSAGRTRDPEQRIRDIGRAATELIAEAGPADPAPHLATVAAEGMADRQTVLAECSLAYAGLFEEDLRELSLRWFTGLTEILTPYFWPHPLRGPGQVPGRGRDQHRAHRRPAHGRVSRGRHPRDIDHGRGLHRRGPRRMRDTDTAGRSELLADPHVLVVFAFVVWALTPKGTMLADLEH